MVLASSAQAVSFEDLLGAANDVTTIEPVSYKGLALDAGDAKAVCLLAGYQMVESAETRPLKVGEKYYDLQGLHAAGVPFDFDLRTAEKYSNDNGRSYYTFPALVRVVCRKRLPQ